MQIVGPDTLTVGQATTIDDPAQGGGNPSVGCQIQNSSPYQLTVLAAGETLSIQPFTAQTVEISGQPMQVTPLASSSTQACTITFVFLLGVAPQTGAELADGTWVETPPMQDGPLTAAAIASLAGTLTTQGVVDNLGTFTRALVANTPQIIPAGGVAALHSYQTLWALVTINSAGAFDLPLTVAAMSKAAPIAAQESFPEQSQFTTGAGQVMIFLLPVAAAAGDPVALLVSMFGVAANVTVTLFGLSGESTSQVVTPYANPLGTAPRGGTSVGSTTLAALASATILPLPPTGFTYRFQRLFCPDLGPVVLSEGGINFFAGAGVVPANPGQYSAVDNLHGLLIQSAITATNLNGTSSARVTWAYDLIPSQTIL